MFNIEDGKKAVIFAREVIESYIKKDAIISSDFKGIFEKKQGVFVTLHTYPENTLRGCIGIPLPVMSLQEAIAESARSATRDPRFNPLRENELNNIVIEITILTIPEIIKVNEPKDYLLNIKIGKDGLIVENGFYKGLLLPQVPIEQRWNNKEFLSQTCMKAGLPPDAWLNEKTKISKFSGQIFKEEEPKGEIVEKNLDGSYY